MTTITYKAGILAADTRASDENGLIFKSKKIEKLSNGTTVGCAGDGDSREVLSLLSKSSLGKMPTKAKLISTKTTFYGIWCFPAGEVFRVEIYEDKEKWIAEILPILDTQVAVGSGAHYALGAMLAGKSAIEAVKIACKLDINSGLPVESVNLID